MADVFVFTLGLTEAWVNTSDGTVYPTAPGIIAGTYDPQACHFANFNSQDVRADLEAFLTMVKAVNPGLRLLLTVSPVPLAATAGGDHVLVATSYSKSMLRAVAGDLARERPEVVTYFPSYEIITGQPTRHMFYAPDLRNVVQSGVDEVMRHFFLGGNDGGLAHSAKAKSGSAKPIDTTGYKHCEEALLGKLA